MRSLNDVYEQVARGLPDESRPYATFADGHDLALVTQAIARGDQEQPCIAIEREVD